MPPAQIHLPATLDLDGALGFSAQLQDDTITDGVVIDYGMLKWVEPFGMLYAAQAINEFQQRRPELLCLAINMDRGIPAHSYAAHIGFFQHCNVNFGNEPGRAWGSTAYLPITTRHTSELLGDNRIGPTSTQVALRLARQLARQPSGALVDAFTYSLSEIIRNVGEHSQSRSFSYCAQYWPSENRVEIGLIDDGIGLRESLSKNPNLVELDDQTAIKYALMPGISGKMYQGVRSDPNNQWENSGFGLYMNYQLCNAGGSFFICSGSKGLHRQQGQENRYLETHLRGTALQLIMDTRQIEDIKTRLEEFRTQGMELAKATRNGYVPSANRMSTMLREGFATNADDLAIGSRVRHARYGIGIIESIIDRANGRTLRVRFNQNQHKNVLAKDIIPMTDKTE
jgi:hypothetical protein